MRRRYTVELNMKKIEQWLIIVLLVYGCKHEVNQPIEIERTDLITFREIVLPPHYSASKDVFYVVNRIADLDTIKSKFIYGTGELLFSKLKNYSYEDTTLIGYTTGIGFGSGARLKTDSIVNYNGKIKAYYTLKKNSGYQDAVSHTSIVAITKTSLPITMGKIIYIE